jgi:hypothetical protein
VVSDGLDQLRSLKFGYVPYRPDAMSPGDRRRFPKMATAFGLDWELYREGSPYDVVYISSNGDLTHFSRLPRTGVKLAFEMVDGYLAVPRFQPKALIRGLGKWVLKKHRHLELFYDNTVKRMAGRADLVVCSTPEQAAMFAPHNSNVHDILDSHEELEPTVSKGLAASKGQLNIFWEGISTSAVHFEQCAEALQTLSKEVELTVFLATDLTYRPLNAPIPVYSTKRILKKIIPGVNFKLAEWSPLSVRALASHCDLGLIPLDLSDELARNKPENKLLIMWRLGLPVITSATPAYRRVMQSYGGPAWACSTSEDWSRCLNEALTSPELCRQARASSEQYLDEFFSEAEFERKWLCALGTLLS